MVTRPENYVTPPGLFRLTTAAHDPNLYNILNSNTVLALNNAFGPAWRRLRSILSGRLLKVGFQLTFQEPV